MYLRIIDRSTVEYLFTMVLFLDFLVFRKNNLYNNELQETVGIKR